MDINPVPRTTSNATPSAPAPSTVLTSDFETFLLMLTTQMQNQDPLNPIESSDFAVQLATFSGVEQQVRTNDLLEQMAGRSAMADLSRWVGLEARVEGDVAFRGQPVKLDLGDEQASAQRRLVVRAPDGSVIESTAIPTGTRVSTWAGVASDGAPYPDANYSMTVEHRRSGSLVDTTEVASYARIVEARSGADGTEVVLADGSVVSAATVAALRDPNAP